MGVSTSGGCEAAAHAAWRYVRDCRHRMVLLKFDMRNAFNLKVWEGIHFCLWHMLEHLASIIFCGRLIPLQPDYSLARRGLPQRQVSSRETQLDPHSLLYRLMKQVEVFSLNLMCYPRRIPGQGSRQFSGITGEAQSNWLGGQWKQM